VIAVPAAGIVPTPSTRAVIDTAPSVRPTLATSGYGRAAANFAYSLRPCGLHPSSAARPLALQNKKVIYGLLFQTCAETLLEVARDPRHLGAEIGFFGVLHSWNQKLEHHPHLHCVVPAGGLSPDHQRWIPSRYRFFLPVKVLRRVFRGKFVAALKRAFADGQLGFYGDLKLLAEAKAFASFLRPLFRQDW